MLNFFFNLVQKYKNFQFARTTQKNCAKTAKFGAGARPCACDSKKLCTADCTLYFLGVAGRRASSQEVCSGCILRRHHCVPPGEAILLRKPKLCFTQTIFFISKLWTTLTPQSMKPSRTYQYLKTFDFLIKQFQGKFFLLRFLI